MTDADWIRENPGSCTAAQVDWAEQQRRAPAAPDRVFLGEFGGWPVGNWDEADLVEYVRADLATAAKVKPLVWEDAKISSQCVRQTAETLFGVYEALQWSDGTYGGSIPTGSDEPNKEYGDLPTLEAAKAAAQADHDARIRAALEPADPMQDPRVKALVKLSQDAASCLYAYVNAEYPEESRNEWPDVMRRFNRDIELVHEINAALAALEGKA